MLALHLAKTVLLWSSVACLWGLAYLRSVSASSFDRRLPWGLPLILGAHVLGLVLARRLGRDRQGQRVPLGPDGHALALIVSALALVAWGEASPYTSIRVLREQIAPFLAWILPALAGLTPILMARTRPRLDVADQALAVTLVLLPLNGAILLLEGPAALCLAVSALALALVSEKGRLPRSHILWPAAATLALLLLASQHGADRLQAAPTVPWILASAALMLTVACRDRSAADWRRLLALPVASATVMALCGVLVTAWLAAEVDLTPALRTRLTLFRQHPNFLAPYFALHAVLAAVLAASAKRGRVLALLACALLAIATWHTDSRAGMALLVIGLGLIPTLSLLARLLRDRHPALLTGLVVLGPVLALALVALIGSTLLPDAWTAGLDRFEKSVDYRMDAWRNSLGLLKEHAWAGIGPGTFLSVERFAPGSRFFNAPESPHPHNVLLYVAQSGGVPALLGFLCWFVWLMARLLAPVVAPRSRLLHLGLAGALLALLAANLLDVGLSLLTVIPEPIFLATGLVASLGVRSDRPPIRPGPATLLALGLLAVTAAFGLRPVIASSLLERAELRAFLSGQRDDDPLLMTQARDDARAAIDYDPDLAPAYELLSRWLEHTDGGLLPAREVLLALIARAPHHGRSSSLLAQLYLRSGMDEEAVAALRQALADSHGSVHLTRDRAQVVACLARLGRRDEALDALVDALRLDVGTIDVLAWRGGDPPGVRRLPVGRAGAAARPLDRVEAVELLYGRYVSERRAGQPVGRRAWMDVVGAFRRAGRDDRALSVLDDLWENVPAVERQSIENERGVIALDAGDGARALEHFESAYALSGNPYFRTQSLRARRLLGEDVLDSDTGVAAFQASGEILDQPTAFRDNLRGRADAAEHAARPGEAGALLLRTLLYEDDPLVRVGLRAQAGELLLRGGRSAEASESLVAALAELDAKPYPRESLTEGRTDSLPARIARDLNRAWSQFGLDASQRLARAWAIPSFFRPTAGATLFRCAFFGENGQPDAQLREADLALLIDPTDGLARWARLEAQEALGQHAGAVETMRDIAELAREQSRVDLERLFDDVVQRGRSRLDDWQAWFDAALVRLLQGRYAEAADLFGNARELSSGTALTAARLAGWQARAELFSGRDGSLRRARLLLQEACDLAPEVGSLRLRLETLP